MFGSTGWIATIGLMKNVPVLILAQLVTLWLFQDSVAKMKAPPVCN